MAAVLLLVALLIFTFQNMADASVAFLGAGVVVPLGVAMLLSAIAGALLVALAWSAHTFRLRYTNSHRQH